MYTRYKLNGILHQCLVCTVVTVLAVVVSYYDTEWKSFIFFYYYLFFLEHLQDMEHHMIYVFQGISANVFIN